MSVNPRVLARLARERDENVAHNLRIALAEVGDRVKYLEAIVEALTMENLRLKAGHRLV